MQPVMTDKWPDTFSGLLHHSYSLDRRYTFSGYSFGVKISGNKEKCPMALSLVKTRAHCRLCAASSVRGRTANRMAFSCTW